jgi:hypothetical protein
VRFKKNLTPPKELDTAYIVRDAIYHQLSPRFASELPTSEALLLAWRFGSILFLLLQLFYRFHCVFIVWRKSERFFVVFKRKLLLP